MNAVTRALVRERANDLCEYCLLPQKHCDLTHPIEHIVSKQHGGTDLDENLALACHRSNLRKGPNLTGIDPVSDELVRLFHPRRDRWGEHFFVDGLWIKGRTPIGRATVRVLTMNDTRRLELRAEWQADLTAE